MTLGWIGNAGTLRRLGAVATLLAPLTGLAGGASAVLPPEVYVEARRLAGHHVQVAVVEHHAPDETPGLCRFRGTVVTVFRSRNRLLEVGTPVALAVDCFRPGDDLPDGPALWRDVGTLQAARFIEVYLDGERPDAMSVADWQYGVIDGPSATPRCPEDDPGAGCH